MIDEQFKIEHAQQEGEKFWRGRRHTIDWVAVGILLYSAGCTVAVTFWLIVLVARVVMP